MSVIERVLESRFDLSKATNEMLGQKQFPTYFAVFAPLRGFSLNEG